MATIDLDARRAARAEAENKPHEVILEGRTYLLRPRMPLEFTDLLNAGRMGEAMQLLLVNPEEWADLRKAVPDDDDLAGIAEVYAVNLPEAGGSAPSSTNGGSSSKATSLSATDLISQTPATVHKRSGSAASKP